MTFDAYEKKLGGSFISTLPEEVARYQADEYCSFVCSYNFYRGFFDGLKRIYKKKSLDGIDRSLPILLLSGTDDPVGKMGKGVKKLEEMYRSLGCKDVSCVLLKGTRHEYLNDKDGVLARETIFDFINRVSVSSDGRDR